MIDLEQVKSLVVIFQRGLLHVHTHTYIMQYNNSMGFMCMVRGITYVRDLLIALEYMPI